MRSAIFFVIIILLFSCQQNKSELEILESKEIDKRKNEIKWISEKEEKRIIKLGNKLLDSLEKTTSITISKSYELKGTSKIFGREPLECNNAEALDWYLLTDTNGISIKFHDSLELLDKERPRLNRFKEGVYYNDSLYTGYVKICINDMVVEIMFFNKGQPTHEALYYDKLSSSNHLMQIWYTENNGNKIGIYLDQEGFVEQRYKSLSDSLSGGIIYTESFFYRDPYSKQRIANKRARKEIPDLNYELSEIYVSIKDTANLFFVKEYLKGKAVKEIEYYYNDSLFHCIGECEDFKRMLNPLIEKEENIQRNFRRIESYVNWNLDTTNWLHKIGKDMDKELSKEEIRKKEKRSEEKVKEIVEIKKETLKLLSEVPNEMQKEYHYKEFKKDRYNRENKTEIEWMANLKEFFEKYRH